MRVIDLYEAFRSVCLDEEEFRGELQRYSSLAPGERVTPKQVPPLVPSGMLRPTSANKMFNAKVEYENSVAALSKGQCSTLTNSRKWQCRKNFVPVTRLEPGHSGYSAGRRPWQKKPEREVSFPSYVAIVSPHDMLEYLRAFKWSEGQRPLERVCEFLGKKHGDPQIDRWLIVAPQPKEAKQPSWLCGPVSMVVRERSRTGDLPARYGVFSESQHVAGAEFLNCLREGSGPSEAALKWRLRQQAIMLFYPVLSEDELARKLIPTMGFALLFPQNVLRTRIKYTVVDQRQKDAVVVDR